MTERRQQTSRDMPETSSNSRDLNQNRRQSERMSIDEQHTSSSYWRHNDRQNFSRYRNFNDKSGSHSYLAAPQRRDNRPNFHHRSSYQRRFRPSCNEWSRRRQNFHKNANGRKYRKKWWNFSRHSFQYRKQHLRELRKTAAMNRLNNKDFVFKPGMITILRPSTPRNTTGYLARLFSNKDFSSSNEVMRKNSYESKKEGLSVQDSISDLAYNSLNFLTRTPVLSFADKLSVNYEMTPNPSEYDEEGGHMIGGTMEGLIDDAFFELDRKIHSPIENQNTIKVPHGEAKKPEEVFGSVSDVNSCNGEFRHKCDTLMLKCDNLNKILKEKDEYIRKLEDKLDI